MTADNLEPPVSRGTCRHEGRRMLWCGIAGSAAVSIAWAIAIWLLKNEAFDRVYLTVILT
jgi:hypothetical protein